MEGDANDEELIAAIGAGDEAALVALMARHRQAVYQFTYRYLGNEADSLEVTEETFFRVFTSAARFKKAKASVRTWIIAIALNLVRDRGRKRSRELATVPLPEIEPWDNAGGPSHAAETQEALAYIHGQIQRLPEKLKFPFIYCVLEEQSYDACAAVLGANRKTVETRIYRARLLLRESLRRFSEKT